MRPIIEVNNFTKQYGNTKAVDNISFSVKEGSIFAFLGPNGAGKSTTINTLCTIFGKTNGELLINGKNVATEKNDVRKAIGIVFQDPTLDNKMTIEENLKLHCVFYDVPSEEVAERLDFVLNLVDLNEQRKKKVSALSGGMKRRVEIARGLIHYPKVLFLDEPTTGLDPQTRSTIWQYIIKLQKERNITIFLTTHYMDEAEICDQIAVIDHGKIIANDTPFALKKQDTRDKAFISTSKPLELERLLTKQGLVFEKKPTHYKIIVDEMSKLLDVLSVQKEAITDIEIKKRNL